MNDLYSRYAIAFVELAKESKLDLYSLRNETNVLTQIFKKELRFRRFLSINSIKLESKYEVIDNVFKGFNHLLINFIKLIVSKNRSAFIYDIFKETLKEFDSYLAIEKGVVYSSTKLSEENLNKLKKALEKKINKTLDLTNVVDESIIGGFKICLENSIYDSTINTRLNKLKETLLKGGK